MNRPLAQIKADLEIVEKRMTLAQQAAGFGIWDWHIPKDILYWDENMMRMFHPKQKTYDLNMFTSCLHPDDIPTVSKLLENTLNGEPYDYRFRIKNGSDGKFTAIRGKGSVVEWDENGAASRMTGVCIKAGEA
jgi:PAS domain-containing protein